MSVVQNTIIGRARGSVGNLTFTTWKGMNVMKSKPTSVHNPNTAGQLSQRAVLKKAVSFYKTIVAVANTGFQYKAIKQSAYNAFVSLNTKSGAFNVTGGVGVLTPSLLKVSDGALTPTPIANVTASTGSHSITVTWETASVDDQNSEDQAFILALDPTGNVLGFGLSDGSRSDGTSTLVLASTTVFTTAINVYMFFVSAGSRKVSTSAYHQLPG